MGDVAGDWSFGPQASLPRGCTVSWTDSTGWHVVLYRIHGGDAPLLSFCQCVLPPVVPLSLTCPLHPALVPCVLFLPGQDHSARVGAPRQRMRH